MQSLIEPPRDSFTADQVRALLTARDIQSTAGCDLLDEANQFVADITEQLAGGSVSRDNAGDVHGSARLQIQRSADRDIAWGRNRLRPFQTLTDGVITARFNLGVYVPSTPSSQTGEDPVTDDVSCFDLLSLLQTGPGDTYVVEAGTSYIQAVRDVVAASQVGAPVLLDGTLQSTTLPSTMVWALVPGDGQASWLRIINDLLAAINYRGLWADQNGSLRSAPYVLPELRPVEWVFDTTNSKTDIVDPSITEQQDAYAAFNWWKFVGNNWPTPPTVGDGLYLPAINADPAHPEDTQLGRIVRKPVQFLDVADQATLVAQGDRIVADDLGIAHTYTISVDPLPIAGHWDVVQLVDAVGSPRCQVSSWELPLDGSRGQWQLEVVGG